MKDYKKLPFLKKVFSGRPKLRIWERPVLNLLKEKPKKSTKVKVRTEKEILKQKFGLIEPLKPTWKKVYEEVKRATKK